MDLGRKYCNVVIALKKLARVDKDLVNARHDLLLGLSEAHNTHDLWFNEKTASMERLAH